jgi:hypothetical protein
MSVELTRRGFFKLIAAAAVAKVVAAPGLVELVKLVSPTEDECVLAVERLGEFDFFMRACWLRSVTSNAVDMRMELTNGPVMVTAECRNVAESEARTLYRKWLEMVHLDWRNAKAMLIEGVRIDVLSVEERFDMVDVTSFGDTVRTFMRAS